MTRVETPWSAPIIPGEDIGARTDRLSRAGAGLGVNRQCSIGWHDECSDPEGESCQCKCHGEEAKAKQAAFGTFWAGQPAPTVPSIEQVETFSRYDFTQGWEAAAAWYESQLPKFVDLTNAEINALPKGTMLLDERGFYWYRVPMDPRWHSTDNGALERPALFGPYRVILRPEIPREQSDLLMGVYLEDLEVEDRVIDPRQAPHWGVIMETSEVGIMIQWGFRFGGYSPDEYLLEYGQNSDMDYWSVVPNPHDLNEVE